MEADGKRAYVPGRAGALEAIDLATGDTLWSARGELHPLLATGSRVFAWSAAAGKSNSLVLFVLDPASKGKVLLESRPVVFPEWVSTGVAHGRHFACTAQLHRGKLYLIWQASAHYAGGAAPPPQIEAAARKSAQGIARISLDSGEVESVPSDQAPAALPRTIPASPPVLQLENSRLSLLTKPVPGARPFPPQHRLFLQSMDKAGTVLWQHEIHAPVLLPPLP